jgi:hypothetical protein
MVCQAILTDGDGLPRSAGAAQFFCEGGESERRRVLVDPASEFLDARAVRHADSLRQEP